MANRKAASQVLFDPNTTEFRPTDPGILEQDDFWINDVVLRISPQDITIQKQSFNNEYNTLRTQHSRKVKSGYGTARVIISTIFRVSNPDDVDKIDRIVAGLRATPFCVARNLYLDRMLGRPDDETPIASENRASKRNSFQPVMLALASMTFSTMGHIQKPDLVQATFDFLWFNYLPFTNVVAFKTGGEHNKPGFAHQSALWKAFYEPFRSNIPIQFPHKERDLGSRTTRFMWREFLMVPTGSPLAIAAAKLLADAIKNRPEDIAKEVSDLAIQGSVGSEWERSDLRNPDSITSGVLDTLFRRAVNKGIVNLSQAPSTGVLSPDQGVREQLLNIQKGAITQAAGGLLAPVIRKLFDKQNYSRAKSSADTAAAILTERLKKVKSIQNRGDVILNQIGGDQGTKGQGQKIQEGKYRQLLDANATYGNKSKQSSAGGLQLFGRKSIYEVSHRHENDTGQPPAAVIQQVVVSFKNTLATIPMLAYNYPTIQHIGSMDAEVSFVINARNSGATDIRKMYDRVETMALRFRQVPAGYTNLNIENDFLALFGLSEFLTDTIEISPIQGQPTRSLVNLTLVDAGITSKDQDPEQIKQEFVQNHSSLMKACWEQISKNTEQLKEKGIPKGFGVVTAFLTDRRDKGKPTSLEYYKLKLTGVQLTGKDEAYAKIVSEAVDIYNKFLTQIHEAVFDQNTVEGSTNYAALMTVSENSPEFGYVPAIQQIKATLQQRNKAYRQANKHKKVRSANFQKQKELDNQARANKIISNYTGNAALGSKAQDKAKRNRAVRLDNMGLWTYLTEIRQVFAKAKNNLRLEQFQHLLNKIDELGLDSGLMAYPDFKPQLKSVAGFIEGVKDYNDNTLMKYEPDCYFYYPLFNGPNSSPLLGVVDPYYWMVARVHSQNIFDNANDRIDGFYKNTYLSRIKNKNHMGPYNVLTKDYGGTQISKQFYKGQTIKNSSVNENIAKTVIVDPNAKIPTNWYLNQATQIKSLQTCNHTTDLNQLWDGIGTSVGGAQSREPAIGDPPPVNQGAITQEAPSVSKSMVPFEFQWPLKPVPLSIGSKFGVPRDDYRGKRRHGGIDIPGKNESKGRFGKSDGIYGRPVYAAADGVVSHIEDKGRVGGLFLQITHKGRWKSEYFHLAPNSILVKKGEAVRAGQYVAQIGRTGNLHSYTHLHFQIRNPSYKVVDPLALLPDMVAARENAQRRKPTGSIKERIDRNKTTPLSRDVTATLSSPLGQAIQSFEEDLYTGQAQSMMRAYPAFKLYFVEDDSEERKRLQFDDFFSYQSVRSIRVIRSRKIAADLCEIYLTNISGILSNRKFRESKKSDAPYSDKNTLAEEHRSATKGGTREENPIASLLLQEGMNIHLRLGYTNDPERMPTVFNGKITEIQFSDSDDMVRVVAQSYASELVQDIKGIEKPKTKSSFTAFGWDFWGFGQNATTGRILEEMLAEPEILHFGRWTPTDEGANPSRDILTQRWTFYPQPQDDNIFAPSPKEDMNDLANGTFFKNLKYIIYRTTIWDIFQEMTLRHPNYIAMPVPYKGKSGERMTMFFGLPNQLYFARDPNAQEEIADEKMRQIQEEAEKNLMGEGSLKAKRELLTRFLRKKNPQLSDVLLASTVEKLLSREMKIVGSDVEKLIKNAANNFYRQDRLKKAKQAGYIKPFRNYHLITSAQHLVQNNIRASSRDVANTIIIKYGTDVEIKDEATGSDLNGIAVSGDEEQFTLKLDNALPTEEIRAQMGQFINVTNPELAKRYALGMLCRNVKDIYKGEIVIIGNPKIKPTDVCYLLDEQTDMVGAFEVEEVQHIFDQQNGFRTEIKPDMLVQAAEFSLLSSTEALGIVMEGMVRKMTGHSQTLAKSFSPTSFIMAHGINMFGGFLSQKLINYTQLAQPVIMSPLLHHGRMFTGGVPTRKIPTSSWSTAFGDWRADADAGYSDWVEDIKDRALGWIKKNTGQFSVGNFWRSEVDYPE